MNYDLFRTPPDLTVSEWADNYRYLSPEGSPEPGKWNTDRAPYQRGMMDAVKSHERVVIMTAAQVGKSEILLNTLGYFLHYDPCPILMVQPTLEMGQDFSKTKIAPMLRDTPVLSGLIGQKTRTSDNNILHKHFKNSAVLSIAGANSPAGLASRSIRVLLCDEVDRYPASAGSEGDPVSLAMARTATFWNRHIVLVSTPTMRGASRITDEFDLSDKSEWHVPCPKCGKYQPLVWENMLYEGKTEPVMKCPYCGHEAGGYEWKSALGRWVKNADSSIPGFHVNAFASPWLSWQEIVAKYMEARNSGPERVKTWTNTALGEPYENMEGVIDLEGLEDNREDYPLMPDGSVAVPDDVLLLTCGVDTQDDRLELEVVGWGLGNQSWGIEYRVIYGHPSGPEVWSDLDAYLQNTFMKANGEGLMIACTCIDSAGHNTDMVYRFCKTRLRRRIFPIVGRGQWGVPSVRKPTRNNRLNVPLFTLGVSTLKGTLHTRLQVKRGESGYCHFPKGGKTGYDERYYAGLLSERMVLKNIHGKEVVRWELRDSKTRNEPLDCRVYAMGAFEILNPDMRRYAGRIVRERPSAPVVENHPQSEPVRKPVPKRRMILRRGISW